MSDSNVNELDELRRLHHDALDRMTAVVEGLTPELMERRTPCTEWNVRELLEHAIGLNLGLAETIWSGSSDPAAYGGRPAGFWKDSADLVAGAFDAAPDDRLLYVPPVSPDLAFSVRDVLAFHLLDLAAHTWDLAVAVGATYTPDPAVLAVISEVAALVASRPLPSTRMHFAAPIRSPQGEDSGWHHVLRLVGRDPAWRSPHDAPLAPTLEAINIRERLGRFSETWSPKIIGRVNDYEVKVVKMLGEFEWHTHHDTDELFVVVDGSMRIEMRHGSVALGPGDLYVVPRGVEHRPVSEGLSQSVLLEPAGVINTGDAGGALTAVDEVLT